MIGLGLRSSSTRNLLIPICIIVLTLGLSACLDRNVPNGVFLSSLNVNTQIPIFSVPKLNDIYSLNVSNEQLNMSRFLLFCRCFWLG
jgi:hypothetical protein